MGMGVMRPCSYTGPGAAANMVEPHCSAGDVSWGGEVAVHVLGASMGSMRWDQGGDKGRFKHQIRESLGRACVVGFLQP